MSHLFYENELAPVLSFLAVATPQNWLDWAVMQQDILLIDHAHCEKKAASTALSLMYRYVDDDALLQRLSKLAREELVHFEQVLKLMRQLGVTYRSISAAPYAANLLALAQQQEPWRLIDRLLISALIEARSCDRFGALVPCLDEPLKSFYAGLLKSEARHFQVYLDHAQRTADAAGISAQAVQTRQDFWCETEAKLILTPTETFRFHSGVPISSEVLA
jgi:tRNA-(ms[2]io[6]A)-hydroxylase